MPPVTGSACQDGRAALRLPSESSILFEVVRLRPGCGCLCPLLSRAGGCPHFLCFLVLELDCCTCTVVFGGFSCIFEDTSELVGRQHLARPLGDRLHPWPGPHYLGVASGAGLPMHWILRYWDELESFFRCMRWQLSIQGAFAPFSACRRHCLFGRMWITNCGEGKVSQGTSFSPPPPICISACRRPLDDVVCILPTCESLKVCGRFITPSPTCISACRRLIDDAVCILPTCESLKVCGSFITPSPACISACRRLIADAVCILPTCESLKVCGSFITPSPTCISACRRPIDDDGCILPICGSPHVCGRFITPSCATAPILTDLELCSFAACRRL